MRHVALAVLLAGCASAPSPTTRQITYTADGVEMRGYLALADGERKAPGVLVVHEWWGHNEYARGRARMLAELGYNALAIDMYGDGRTAGHPDDASAFMQEATSSLDGMVARFRAALDALRAEPSTDPDRIAAIGYCFGGGVVLHMARTGMELAGVASFHGSLAPLTEVAPGRIRAEVLVCHGTADAMITDEQAQAFRREMRDAGADFQFVPFEGAQHGFTNPEATAVGQAHGLPLAYDAQADAESWEVLERFLARIFGS